MQLQQHQQQQQMMQQGAHLPTRPSESTPVAPAPTRSGLDKILDFVLNDGPNNKYALICPGCYGHNGLVQESDLGRIRYKCAMCGRINGPPPTQQQQQHQMQTQMQQAGVAGGMQMSPLPPHTPGTKDGSSSSVPLTPFAPLSTPSRDDRSRSVGSRSEVDPEHILQREAALAEAEDENAADGSADAAAPSRNSRAGSRRGSEKKEAGETAAARVGAAAVGSGESGGDSDGFEEVDAEEAAATSSAPRKRKGAAKK